MKNFIQYVRQQVKEAYNPFDSLGPGNHERDWRLRMNISREEHIGIASKCTNATAASEF